jgi:hypothetical protein
MKKTRAAVKYQRSGARFGTSRKNFGLTCVAIGRVCKFSNGYSKTVALATCASRNADTCRDERVNLLARTSVRCTQACSRKTSHILPA